jgi:pimeloyl-ACP methyl ester carboxylesterase
MHKKILIFGGLIYSPTILSQLVEHTCSDVSYEMIDINSFNPFREISLLSDYLSDKFDSSYSVIIVAYSTGALPAIYFTSMYQKQVTKMILINATPSFMEKPNWRGCSEKNFTQMLTRLRTQPLDNFINHFITLSLYPNLKNISQMHKFCSPHCNQNNIEAWLQFLKNSDFRNKMIAINNLPILTIYSEKDAIIPNANNFTRVNISKQILVDASHADFITPKLHSLWQEAISV